MPDSRKKSPERKGHSLPGNKLATSPSQPSRGDEKAHKRRDSNAPVSVVGIGASAGGVQALQHFFGRMPADSGLAFVVVMHLSPDHTSNLAEILQSRTEMPVVQVTEAVKVERNHVYVIPPNKHLSMRDSQLVLSAPQQETGRRVTIDLFFRTLAEHYGQRAVCIILSGTDSDGVIGLKHIKAQGGVTIAQEPAEAEHDSMPRHAIETGMVDWILPVTAMPARLCDYVQNEKAITLPPEKNGEEEEAMLPDLAEGSGGGPLVANETTDPDDENALAQILFFLRSQTGHDFSHYKRATVLRRIARRLQVNSLETLPAYLEFLQTHSGESGALLSDLLINVTHFFRDQNVFAAFAANVPQLFAGKGPNDQLRVWVPACATGEEAYSIAILLCEVANRLEKPPQIQIFATDIDDEAVHRAREGVYPTTIEADVSQERLRRYFFEYHGQYRIKKEVREMLLFAPHDLLRDSPFSRLDLISCRNLLIYLKPEAQHRALDIFHFGLRPGGLLVLGNAEGVDGDHTLFASLDKQNRIYVRRNTARLPMVQLLTRPRRDRPVKETVVPRFTVLPEVTEMVPPEPAPPFPSPERQRLQSLSEMHARLIEEKGPPSLMVDENYDIVHMSARAGAYLRLGGGEPSANLLKLVDESLRLELRTALFRAGQAREPIFVSGIRTQRDGQSFMVDFRVWALGAAENEAPLFLVMLDERAATKEEKIEPAPPQPHEPVARHLEEELRQTRARLNSTVEHYETSNEELKAANKELQAMNEEMRSATEELETSKEELQSVNEELTTLNQELKSNIEEVNRANSDLQNLIASTDIATVFLDVDLRIKRYTPKTQELFNVIPADLGRPLSDITTKLEYPTLTQDAARVLRSLEKIEREVPAAGNNVFLTRLSPYRTIDDRISGVVIAFIKITAAKAAELALAKSEEEFRRAIEEAPIPMIMQAEDGQVLQISRSWTELTGYTQEDTPTFEAWVNKAYGFGGEDVRERVRQLFQGEKPMEQVEFEIITRDGTRRTWSFSASPIGMLRDGRRFITGMALDVTERKRASAALRESDLRFRMLADNIAQLAWICDTLGNVIWYNKRWLDYTGLSFEEMKGWDWSKVQHPDHLERVVRRVQRSAETGEPWQDTFPLKGRDGRYRWFLSRAVPIQDESGAILFWFGTNTDITEQREIEEELRESRERYRLLVEGTPDYAMFLIDPTNVIVYWSAGAEKIFGWKAEEALGKSGRLIFTPQDRSKSQEEKEIATALREGVASDRRWHMRKDGTRVWIDGVMRRIEDEKTGELRGFAKIARDATEDRQIEDRLRAARDQLEQRVHERTSELQAMNETLAAEMERRHVLEREILQVTEGERARISQDLHDSLCQELTATAFLLKSRAKAFKRSDPEASEALAEAAETVNANADLARDLAHGLHAFEFGAGGLPSALRDLCSRTPERLACRCKAPRSMRLDEVIAANLYRIAQEAVTNAIKHAKPSEIVICLERDGDDIVLSVKDDGKGISKPNRQRSKGMGLHLMKYRANACGGTIEIESGSGTGTIVRCRVRGGGK